METNMLGLPVKESEGIVRELNVLLSNYQVYYQNLRGLHWNIRGKRFFNLHVKFEELYNDAQLKIDLIAERVLTIGGKPLHTFEDYMANNRLTVGKDISNDEKAVHLISESLSNLLKIERKILEDSSAINDEGTNNLMGDFILAYDGRLTDQPGFAFEAYVEHILERPLSLARAFWQGYLTDVSPSFFPLMAHWEDAVDPTRKLQEVRIDIGMSPANLTDFCNERSVTLVNIFQLAWGLVLKQYIGSEDVCFGYLSSGRDAPLDGIEQGVGA
ncbi:MAG: hypothetical protein EOO48_11410, partial [Flavobacterium sp.]